MTAGDLFRVAPGQTLTAMALGPLLEAPFPGEPRPGEDTVDYVFVNGNVAVGDLPCRQAVRAFVAARGVPEYRPFEVARLSLPGSDRRLDFSGFWHQPTRLARWGRVRLVPAGQGRRMRLGTCGGIHVWVDGRHVAGFEPYDRNRIHHTEVTLPLSDGGSDLVILMEDMAERDTVFAAELTWLGDAPLDVSLPGQVSADRLEDLLAVARDVRPDRVAFEAADRLSLVTDRPPGRAVTVQAEVRPSVHLSHHPPLARRQATLAAGQTRIDLGGLTDLPDGYHPLDLTFSVGDTVVDRHIAFAVLSARTPPSLPTDLDARKRMAQDFAARHGEPRAGRVLARLDLGLPWDDVAQAILDDTVADIEGRKDCSDFIMVPLLWIVAAHADAMPPAARAAAERAILGYRYWMDEPGNDVMWFWSENHVLCFHASELLAGRMFPDRVFANSGMTGTEHAAQAGARLDRWFDAVERDGLAEWNSAAYYPIDFIGLFGLWRWAGADIGARAGALLDRIFAMVALHTIGGVAAGSMGRAYDKELRAGPLPELAPFAAVAFGQGWLNPGVAALPMFCACDYAPPEGLARLARPADGEWLEAAYVQGHGSAAKLKLCKTAHMQLSASVDAHPGQPGHQQHLVDVQAAAAPFARVWINHPGEDDPWGSHRPSYWAGNGIQPRVAMDGGTALVLFDLGAAPRLPMTHAYAPLSEFDDWRAGDDWMVLRAGRGGVLLKATAPIRAVTSGPGAGLEFRVDGARAGWVLQVADLPAAGLDGLAGRAAAMRLCLDPDRLRLRAQAVGAHDYLLDTAQGLSRDGVAVPFPAEDVRPRITVQRDRASTGGQA